MARTRREILAGGAAALGWATFGGLERAAAAALRGATAPAANTVVVALNLFGGNDGLNTVVPLRQYQRYRQLRPTLALERNRLLPLAGHAQDFALNPGMRPLARLFAAGKMAIVNGVGCPTDAQGLFDHEASQQNFLTGQTWGSAPPTAPSGWLGRYLDRLAPASLPGGIDFSSAPLLLSGETSSPLSLNSINGFGVYPSDDFAARYAAYARLHAGAVAPGVAERNRALRQQVLALGGALQAISDGYAVAGGVTYPPTYLAAVLRDCAALIAADRGVRAIAVGHGGFDTHAGQQEVSETTPYHEGLWLTAAEAIDAFYADLVGHGLASRVLLLVFSEFGRRAEENSDLGTDHGLAAPLLAIGDPVAGGIYGDYPDLSAERLVLDGNLDVSVDFRRVYATVLARHLGVDPGPILGGDHTPLGFLG